MAYKISFHIVLNFGVSSVHLKKNLKVKKNTAMCTVYPLTKCGLIYQNIYQQFLWTEVGQNLPNIGELNHILNRWTCYVIYKTKLAYVIWSYVIYSFKSFWILNRSLCFFTCYVFHSNTICNLTCKLLKCINNKDYIERIKLLIT